MVIHFYYIESKVAILSLCPTVSDSYKRIKTDFSSMKLMKFDSDYSELAPVPKKNHNKKNVVAILFINRSYGKVTKSKFPTLEVSI